MIMFQYICYVSVLPCKSEISFSLRSKQLHTIIRLFDRLVSNPKYKALNLEENVKSFIGFFHPKCNTCKFTSMPTLSDYLRVSRIQPESPALLYGSPNPPDNTKGSTLNTFFRHTYADFWHCLGKFF